LELISRRRLLAASGGAVLAGVLGSKAALALDPGPMPAPSPWSRRWDIVLNMRAATTGGGGGGGAGAGARAGADADAAAPAAAAPAAQAAQAGGPVTMDGLVYPVGAVGGDGSVASGVRPVGTVRVTGTVYDPARGRGAYMMIISIDAQGDVILSGVLESAREDVVSVLGGTERFAGVGGDALIMWYNRPAGALRASLNITTI
jgi:hypothetical protein